MERIELLQKAIFDVEIKHDYININEKAVSYTRAMKVVAGVLQLFKLSNEAVSESIHETVSIDADQEFVKQLQACMDDFGFRGFGSINSKITISAYMPVTKLTNEKHTCPRRSELPSTFKFAGQENEDTWNLIGDDKCCSYCGSLHPDRVIELIKQHGFGIIERSTKNYKWYINRPDIPNAGFGGIKFYLMHATIDFEMKYNELVQQRTTSTDNLINKAIK